nr:Klus pretoxin [Saccharomyces cerevisiae killer virus Mlus]
MHLKGSGLYLLYLLTTVLSLAAATIVPPTVDNHTVHGTFEASPW